ncbi:MAG: magnesium and cobalt transport protein CorA [Gammaproteobacteria bacterium]|nr:magnesium and cobalt transport protein CorA [Gammaproteobacteria bacterium]MBU1408968.1 magnesium and cobalt transport protein CorA [Gammaproteobacteria bacterium]MBU1533611.1 magnesium and cobalt transport protein CorA [Gammaproteobacteria bacterium]
MWTAAALPARVYRAARKFPRRRAAACTQRRPLGTALHYGLESAIDFHFPAGAIIDCLLFKDSSAQAIAFDDISDHVGQPDRFIWVELKSPDTRTITRLGDELGLHALALEDAISTHQRSKLEEYDKHVFIATRTVQLWESRMELGETHLFVGSNYVIAIRHDNGAGYQRVTDRLQRRPNGIKAGTPYALYLVLDLIVDQFRPVIEGMQDRFQSLESLLMRGEKSGRDTLERLYAMKRDLTLLRDVAEPMQDITQDLIRLHPALSPKELKAYYRDIHDHAIRVSAAIDRLRMSTSDAMQFHLASLSLKQNESVQKLAGWGALLALPTVVFSLYGMNFEVMPELEWPWAYPALLLTTAVAVGMLYRRLKRRGWI